MFGCGQLVVGRIHAQGKTLDFMMTDVPEPIKVTVVVFRGNSDHSSLTSSFRWHRLFHTSVLVGKFLSLCPVKVVNE